MAESQNHALVFGASGLLGWSVVDQLLLPYPDGRAFENLTAVINRPLSESEFHWPRPAPGRPKLQLVAGIDLLHGTGDDLAAELQKKVTGIEDVTHVFYFVFKQVDDYISEVQANCGMMKRVVDALNTLAPRLTSFVFPGGTRGYGIYAPGGTFQPPLAESMADNLPEDYARTVAYPAFRQLLSEASKGREWTWSEVCPDTVVGFTPHGSGWSLALHWAQYLSLFAHNHGVQQPSQDTQAVEVPFPGSDAGFGSLHTPVSSHTLGRVAVYASLHPEQCGRRILNVADSERPTSFRELWPALAAWFGLVGVGPTDEGSDTLKPGEYVARHRQVFEAMGLSKAASGGVGVGSAQLDSVGSWLTFDRQLGLGRLRAAGYVEERDPVEGWLEAFAKFRGAGIIL